MQPRVTSRTSPSSCADPAPGPEPDGLSIPCFLTVGLAPPCTTPVLIKPLPALSTPPPPYNTVATRPASPPPSGRLSRGRTDTKLYQSGGRRLDGSAFLPHVAQTGKKGRSNAQIVQGTRNALATLLKDVSVDHGGGTIVVPSSPQDAVNEGTASVAKRAGREKVIHDA